MILVETVQLASLSNPSIDILEEGVQGGCVEPVR